MNNNEIANLEKKGIYLKFNNEEETNLRIMVYKAQKGGEKEKEKVLVSQSNFMKKVVLFSSDTYIYLKKGIAIEDLFQCGFIGILKAIKRFDFRKDIKVKNFMALYIKYEIKNEYRNYGTVFVSRELISIARNKLKNMHVDNERINHKELFAIADNEGIDRRKAITAAQFMTSKCKIYELTSNGYVEFPDFKCAEKFSRYVVQEYFTKEEDSFNVRRIREAKANLPPIERIVLDEIFEKDQSQSKVAIKLGYSPSAICRIKKRALSHIKESLFSPNLC